MKHTLVVVALTLATAQMTAAAQQTAAAQTNYAKATKYAEQVESQIDNSADASIKLLGQRAIDILIRKGTHRLRLAGYKEEATNILNEWENDKQFNLFDSLNNRHIGDHSPLSEWLRNVDLTFRFYLGVNIWKGTHLSDLESLNSGLPVVLRPCTFDMDNVTIAREEEYKNHFAKDVSPAGGDELYGVTSVLTYWTVEIPCIVGTSGLGGLVCSPLSAIAESIMGKRIGPALSDRVYDKACN